MNLPDKNNRGAWLLIAILLSAVAGFVMVKTGVVQ